MSEVIEFQIGDNIQFNLLSLAGLPSMTFLTVIVFSEMKVENLRKHWENRDCYG